MIIFPDSNIFAHYRPIEHWDWDKILDKPFQIGLSTSIVNELDKIKYTADSNKIRNRIRDFLNKLKSSKDSKLNGISFKNCGFTWDNSFLSNYNLDKENKDDNFLGSVLKYMSENPEEKVLAISGDYGVRLKTDLLKIPFLMAPDEYLILEDDKENQAIKKLSAELHHLKNRQPKLELSFENKREFIEYSLAKPHQIDQEELEDLMKATRRKFPVLVMDPVNKEDIRINGLLLPRFDLFPKTPEKIEKYNMALELFYSDYEIFLKKQKAQFYTDQLIIQINLELSNSGTLSAEDIDIYLHFPDGFLLSDKNLKGKREAEPEPPDLAEFGLAIPNLRGLGNPINFDYLSSKSAFDFGQFSIKKSNSYDVRQHFTSLKHNELIQIRPLYCAFEKLETVQNFNMNFVITSGNIVDKIIGKLHVIVNKAA